MNNPVVLRFPTGNGNETRLVDLTDLDLAAVKVGIRGLAREGRYGNLLPGEGVTYSVLLHSMLVSMIVDQLGGSPRTVLGAMTHDAPEGLGLKDIPSPVKKMMRTRGDDGYDILHGEVQEQVDRLLGIPELTFEDHDMIERADALALRVEQDHFQAAGNAENAASFGFTPVEFQLARASLYCVLPMQGLSESHQVATFFDILESNKRVYHGESTMEQEANLFAKELADLLHAAVLPPLFDGPPVVLNVPPPKDETIH